MLLSWLTIAYGEEPGGTTPAAEEAPLPTLSPEAEAYRAQLEGWLVKMGSPAEEAPLLAASMVGFEEGIAWRTGTVSVADATVSLELGPEDRYAGPADTSKILEAWGNPPDADTLGMWLPAGNHLFGEASWAVLIRQERDGWVDDADAASIDYDELLTSMKEREAAAATERRAAGVDGLELLGWAEPPHYDSSSKVLYWATTIRADSGGETLNYDVRVLGRGGVLSLNALASPEHLPVVKREMERIRTRASFGPGNRYADYVPGVDNKAAYGLAALVAGGAVAAKTGLFKGLLVALLASKKLLVAGAVGAVTMARGAWAWVRGTKTQA